MPVKSMAVWRRNASSAPGGEELAARVKLLEEEKEKQGETIHYEREL